MIGKDRIYLDHAATTPIHPQVLEIMGDSYQRFYGNPSSLHQTGRVASEAILQAREQIAESLGANHPGEIIFTSSGSEADNLAIIGVALANQQKGKHIITSQIEHHAVLHACKYLEEIGFEVSYLPVNKDGLVQPESLAQSIQPDTILVSIMHANNEIGSIQPIQDLAAVIGDYEVYFHCDAVQSIGQLPVDINDLKVDLLTISAHKFYGPKGVGALYVKDGVKLTPLVHGGNQEYQRRAGTENVPGIIGMALALKLALKDQEEESARLADLREKLLNLLLADLPEMQLNGHPHHRLPNNLNIAFKGIEAEGLLLRLNQYGIEASMGSACNSESIEPSHVINAIGLDQEWERGVLRLSLGKGISIDHVTYTASTIIQLINEMRI